METETPAPVVTQGIPKKRNFLPFIIAGAVFVLILLALLGIIVGLSVLKKTPVNIPALTPTPTQVPTPFEIVVNSNPKFASDSALLKLRDNLKALNAEIGSANFFEPEISPPSIDLNLQIE